jgi:23S rRNA (pseudouridine1915-N3)-methyltransferase
MTIYVVVVGRVKSPSLRKACEEYEARTRHYVKLEVREVREGGLPDRDAERIRKIEGEALLKAIPRDANVVAVTRNGKSLSSSELAQQLDEWKQSSRDVAFIVGGAHGLDEIMMSRAQSRLSLSQMTFPHELARLTLLEQLYRACTILRGEPYHKGG